MSAAAEPFARLPGHQADWKQPTERPQHGSVLLAIPEPPEAAEIKHRDYGRAVTRWVYRDSSGAPLIAVARFEISDTTGAKKKAVLPLRFDFTGPQPKWAFGAVDFNRPLYGLDKLCAEPHTTVLVVEGEKTADAAKKLFPDFVVVTSQGGAKAAGKTDWAPLSGRDLVIWPDQDEPGRAYAQDVAAGATRAGARTIRIVDVPTSWPAAWDLADDPPPSVTVRDLLRMAEPRCSSDQLIFIEPRTLQGRMVPEREWIVEGLVPAGCATLLYGDGGTGKSLLAQQLMTSCATRRPWIGLAATLCRSLALFCEDDEHELHRRQHQINKAYGIEFDDLDDMTWASGAGRDNVLVRYDFDGTPRVTPRYDEIISAAIAFGARLIIIDTAADTFGGNENDRGQVRQYMGLMNALAMRIGGAVVINAHPSRSGMSSQGDMDGGSTAWSNGSRSRLSLARPKPDDVSASDTNERVLVCRKSNYAAIGGAMRLEWRNGVIMPINQPSGMEKASEHARAESVFLALLAGHKSAGRRVSQSNRGLNYAPKVFAASVGRQGLSRKDFEGAMVRLFANGQIHTHNFGRASRKEPGLVITAEVDPESS